MPVLPRQFRSKCVPNRSILFGRGKVYPLGYQVSGHRQLVLPFAPVYLVGSHPHRHVVEAQPRMRRLHMGEEHSRHHRVAFAKDSAGILSRRFTHQGHCEGLGLLGQVLATPFPGRGHKVHRAVVGAAPARQGICVATRAHGYTSCRPLRLRFARQLSATLGIQMFGKFKASARGKSLGF
jgi:hypothetical protein